jgi:Arc/MetJ family transcription regulator
MAITSVDVDQEAIREVKRLTGMKSDREVIREAVAMLLVRARQRATLRQMAEHPFTDEQLNATVIEHPL